MTYLTESPVGKFGKGVLVETEDFSEGRAAELVRMGILTPTDGSMPLPLDKMDAAGLRKRVKALEDENKNLRTSTDASESLAKVIDLEKENELLRGDNAKLQTMNADLSQGVVKKAEYDNLNDQLKQLQTLHDSTVKELDAANAKLAATPQS